MKTITIDFDTYQSELTLEKFSGQTEALQKFKAELLNRLEVRNAPIEKAIIQFGVPLANLNQAKEAGTHWFKNNFTDDELYCSTNRRVMDANRKCRCHLCGYRFDNDREKICAVCCAERKVYEQDGKGTSEVSQCGEADEGSQD